MSNEHDLRQFRAFVDAQEAAAPEPRQGTCPDCGGSGYRRVEIDGYEYVKPCACKRERMLRETLDAIGLPRKFRNLTLDANPRDGREPFRPYGGLERDPVAIASQESAVELMRDLRDVYIDAFVHGRSEEDLFGLMLYGDCGLGKTRLACALLCDLVHAGLEDVRFVEYNELFKLIRFSFNESNISYRGLLEGFVRTEVLVIDDFGMEISNNLTWVLDNIGYIVNERYVANLPTIMTSNNWHPLSKKEDEKPDRESTWGTDEEEWEHISYRLRSRISEMCHEVRVEGFDYRKKLARIRDLKLKVAREKRRGRDND